MLISKIVTGEFGDKAKEFIFEVNIENIEGTKINGNYKYLGSVKNGYENESTAPENGEITFLNGKAQIKLSHGQQIIIKNLPPSCTYTVIEKEENQDGYKTTYNGKTESVIGILGEDSEVNVVNNKETVLENNISDNSNPNKPSRPNKSDKVDEPDDTDESDKSDEVDELDDTDESNRLDEGNESDDIDDPNKFDDSNELNKPNKSDKPNDLNEYDEVSQLRKEDIQNDSDSEKLLPKTGELIDTVLYSKLMAVLGLILLTVGFYKKKYVKKEK